MAMRGRGGRGNPTRPPRLIINRVYEEFKPMSERRQEEDHDLLLLYLPGFQKEYIKVTTEDVNIVRIRGERLVSENKWSRFQEDYLSPENCEMRGIRAKFNGGILTITMPRKITNAPSPPPTTTAKVDSKTEEQPFKRTKIEETLLKPKEDLKKPDKPQITSLEDNTLPVPTKAISSSPPTKQPSKLAAKTKEPTKHEPQANVPSKTEPQAIEPSKHEPQAKKPSKPEPQAKKPSKPKPQAKEPSKPKSQAKEPSKPEPKANEPSKHEPQAKEPSKTEPQAIEPSKHEPQAKKPSKDELQAKKSSKPKPQAKEPSKPKPQEKEPSKPESQAWEPSKTEPQAKEPSKPEPQANEPSKHEPRAKEPSKPESPAKKSVEFTTRTLPRGVFEHDVEKPGVGKKMDLEKGKEATLKKEMIEEKPYSSGVGGGGFRAGLKKFVEMGGMMNEDRKLLVNVGVGVLVIAALGVHVSYTIGLIGKRK
ncbi:hypothetical protein R6Q57_021110 [Mikania cordata]